MPRPTGYELYCYNRWGLGNNLGRGGGHGLATAYYLAKEHNITNVAILEKGWIGGGNVGRNTTIIMEK